MVVCWTSPGVSWGFKIPCKKQYRVHVVVFRDPSWLSWGPSWGYKFLAKNNTGRTSWFLAVLWELLFLDVAEDRFQMAQDRLEMA